MPITITATPVVNMVGRNANHFGVGEIVDLQVAVAPAPVMTPAWRWDVTMGGDLGHFSYNGNHARVILFALAGGTMTVRVRNALDNSQVTVNLTIVDPSNWSLGPSQYNYHEAGMAHAAFRAAMQVHNQYNVSFDNLEVREGNARSQSTGRLAAPGVHHNATFPLAANWFHIGNSRTNVGLQAAASPGHIAVAIDRVSSEAVGPPFGANGTFTWRIPWAYRLHFPVGQPQDVNGQVVQVPDRGNRQCNNVITHHENLVGNAMTISKGGRNFTYNAAMAAVGIAAAF